MKIAYLGTGTWGFCLASLLANKGYQVVCWTKNGTLASLLTSGQEHPHLPGQCARPGMTFTTDLSAALENADIIVESVTAAGIRPVFNQVREIELPTCPIIITSKGIEQKTCLILPEIALEIFGESARNQIACLSGPGYAQEVISGLPTSVVGSAFDYETMIRTCDLFMSKNFRVYPNADIHGVAYGGALKNIIAIACGISDGLKLGNSSKAALMTRGLHEIRKLAIARGCKAETLNGLSGMGDVSLTCGSLTSRNSRYGYLIAQGLTPKEAEVKIDMVVEGAYTAVSALEIGRQEGIELPITEAIYKIIYENLSPLDAVRTLMQRTIKEEHL